MPEGALFHRADVVIIGGGLIGCLSALALTERGLSVVVIERGPFGEQSASRAAAGMLQMEPHANPAMRQLCVASRARYPDLVERLEDWSGLTVGYRRVGGLCLAFDPPSHQTVSHEATLHAEVGVSAEWLEGDEVRRLEPELSPRILGAMRYEDDAVIDPPLLLAAARAAAEARGARVVQALEVIAIDSAAGRVTGVTTPKGRIAAQSVVLAAGSWSSRLRGTDLPPGSVEPMRGQMLEVRLKAAPIDHLVVAPEAYLSPRRDGRVLIGATIERAGYEAAVTAGAAARLLGGAIAAVPALEGAHLTGHWSGFRPRTADEMPAIGPGAAAGLVIATGHFRSGVVLAPLTAEIVAAFVLGEEPPVDCAPFSPRRL